MKNSVCGKLIIIEGMHFSGKSTFCKHLKEEMREANVCSVYNHGAMSHTSIGEELHNTSMNLDVSIGSIFYLSDLLINTNKFIKEQIDKGICIIQDRYYESVSTYLKAYGKLRGYNYDIDTPIKYLKNSSLLLEPFITIYCMPKLEIIEDRISKGKPSPIHDFYSSNPSFSKLVYNEIISKANTNKNCILVDTSNDKAINNAVNKVINNIKVTNY